MIPNPQPTQTRNRLLLLAVLAWSAATFAYAIYGATTLTGLGGWVVTLQWRLMGVASIKLTILLVMLMGYLPLLAVGGLFRKVAPAETREFAAYVRARRNAGFPNPMTWGFVLAIPAIMTLVGGIVVAVLYSSHMRRGEVPVGSAPTYDDVLIVTAITIFVSGMTFLMLWFAKFQNARVQRGR